MSCFFLLGATYFFLVFFSSLPLISTKLLCKPGWFCCEVCYEVLQLEARAAVLSPAPCLLSQGSSLGFGGRRTGE